VIDSEKTVTNMNSSVVLAPTLNPSPSPYVPVSKIISPKNSKIAPTPKIRKSRQIKELNEDIKNALNCVTP